MQRQTPGKWKHIKFTENTYNQPICFLNIAVASIVIRELQQISSYDIFIIIIKKGRQCKAERELYTPYQSEDPSPTILTYRQKEEKEKNSRRQ